MIHGFSIIAVSVSSLNNGLSISHDATAFYVVRYSRDVTDVIIKILLLYNE
jgi:hypothetical protein